MSSLIDALKCLLLPSAKLSPLERVIFDAVRVKLSTPDAELWAKQLQVINKIHRSPDKREVNLFVMRNGKSEFPRELCFEKDGEFKVAVVDLMAKRSATKLRARVWCVNGHVFSIEYKTSSRVFEEMAQGEWEVSCHIETNPS
ncbi:hypothetical protein [Massilia cavernae]|uniref:hypothetical protein n=1 Tax=Massilia cavernae TaxID=2320864 RepID=UPI0011C457BD|nr:hypothetical protein [Massilia cavernae]